MRIHDAGLAIGLAVLLLASCSEDRKKQTEPDPNEPFPYSVPSVATMQVNTEDLGPTSLPAETGLCHAVSAIVVAWVDTNVRLRLAIPVAVYASCVMTTPAYLGDDRWRWTAEGGQGADEATGELTAHVVSATRIDWEMRISGTIRGLDHFLWVGGTSDPAAGSGVWRYFDPLSLQAPKELVRCTWSQSALVGGDTEVAFLNVDVSSPNVGDQLRYRIIEYQASILFRNAAEAESTEVSWSLLTGEGRAISAPGDTCCWGARPSYPDLDCPHDP